MQMTIETILPPPDVREAAVYEKFRALGIVCKTLMHRPVFTVEDSSDVYAILLGAHTKNLFLKDQKGGLWLVCLLCDTRLDLKALAKALGAPRFSFGSPELLIEILGIVPGAVNPFAIINDTGGKVRVVLDEAMLKIDPVNFHPMRNDRTTAIAPEDLIVYLTACGHPPIVAAMPQKG